MTPDQTLQALWQLHRCDPAALETLRFTGPAEQLPSSYHVGPVAAASIAAQALAAAGIWRMRTGRAQSVEIPLRHAQAMFRSERYLTLDGKAPTDLWSPISGYYQAGDGRWVQIHTNFRHHLDGVLKVLGCGDGKEQVAAAIGRWNAAELDNALAEAGLCAALVRTPEEWQAHPQAAAVAALPLFELVRIGDAPPEGVGAGAGQPQRPLDGVKVLDLSRIIAAPVAGRALAQHGAQVLGVCAAHLPNIPPLLIDTGRGKRNTNLDLREDAGRAALRRLAAGADVFIQAYRPGVLAGHGFGPEELCALRPGLVYVTLSAYSHQGPWAARRGFDSLVQSASGIAWREGQASGAGSTGSPGGPGKLPCQALDHATGYLAAFGAMLALQRRAVEGGSWMVRVSLAQTGHWLGGMGTATLPGRELMLEEVADCVEYRDGPFGRVGAVMPVERMSDTPPRLELPPAPQGAHGAEWV